MGYVCYDCGVGLTENNSSKRPRSENVYPSNRVCRSCQHNRNIKRMDVPLDETRAYYCIHCLCELTDNTWRENEKIRKSYSCRNCSNAKNKANAENIKSIILCHYGNSCVICGSKQKLQIDHTDGNGFNHRKTLGSFGGPSFYRWLIENNFPEGYQVLCAEHNWAKSNRNMEQFKDFIRETYHALFFD